MMSTCAAIFVFGRSCGSRYGSISARSCAKSAGGSSARQTKIRPARFSTCTDFRLCLQRSNFAHVLGEHQLARQVVGPAVVRAHDVADRAFVFIAQARAAVTAHVVERADRHVVVAHDQDRIAPQFHGHVVARLRNVRLDRHLIQCWRKIASMSSAKMSSLVNGASRLCPSLRRSINARMSADTFIVCSGFLASLGSCRQASKSVVDEADARANTRGSLVLFRPNSLHLRRCRHGFRSSSTASGMPGRAARRRPALRVYARSGRPSTRAASASAPGAASAGRIAGRAAAHTHSAARHWRADERRRRPQRRVDAPPQPFGYCRTATRAPSTVTSPTAEPTSGIAGAARRDTAACRCRTRPRRACRSARGRSSPTRAASACIGVVAVVRQAST